MKSKKSKPYGIIKNNLKEPSMYSNGVHDGSCSFLRDHYLWTDNDGVIHRFRSPCDRCAIHLALNHYGDKVKEVAARYTWVNRKTYSNYLDTPRLIWRRFPFAHSVPDPFVTI